MTRPPGLKGSIGQFCVKAMPGAVTNGQVAEALLVATRIALLHNGRLAVLATPADFLRAQGEEARAFLACLDSTVEPA